MNGPNPVSRRDFLRNSAASAASAALLASGNFAHASVDDTIRVGVIGCGGRGTDAARNVLDTKLPGIEIVALADVFPERLEGAKNSLRSFGPQFKVKDDTCFLGFDAYKKLLATNCNYVILATPPGFRPEHFRAAVEAGKNVFTEKPVAVDAPGVRSFIESGEKAKAKGLSVVAGTQRRHQAQYLETIKRIHDGAIGEVVSAQVYWNQGGLWMHPRRPEWSDLEWQMRNWYYLTWLCGDHIVEQHVHNLDVANWVLNAHPAKAVGVGGRQVRTDPAYGHIWDHFGLEYEYPNGARVLSMCKHWDNTASRVSEHVIGTRGTSDPGRWIRGAVQYRFDGDAPNPYVQEHADNIQAIRSGRPLNEARQVAESTLTAILGREACYTGQEITWDQMMACNTVLAPPAFRNGAHPASMNMSLPVPPVAMPGRTQLDRNDW